jgi:uncharacterized membrane protein HdeD (DUF308 family)
MSVQAGAASNDAEKALSAIGRSWLWALVFSVVNVVAGILILAWPEETARIFAIILGLQFIALGVARFVTAFAPEHAYVGSRVLYVLLSLLSILAGVLCLRHQLQSVTVLALIVGAVWLLGGIVLIFTSIVDRGGPGRGLRVAAGGLSVVAGIVVLGYPTQSVIALARLTGLWLVLLGLFDVGVAFAMWLVARRESGPDSAPTS